MYGIDVVKEIGTPVIETPKPLPVLAPVASTGLASAQAEKSEGVAMTQLRGVMAGLGKRPA